MRHKRRGRKLGITTKHRKSMFRNMVTDLFRHESIKTTDTRAKDLRRVAEKIITLAKKQTLSSRREAAGFIRDKDVVRKLFQEIAPRYSERPGGYTRIVKLGFRRGDNAPISLVELVEEEFTPKPKKKEAVQKKSRETPPEPDQTAEKSPKQEAAEELGLTEEELKEEATTSPQDNQTDVSKNGEAVEKEKSAPAAETSSEEDGASQKIDEPETKTEPS